MRRFGDLSGIKLFLSAVDGIFSMKQSEIAERIARKAHAGHTRRDGMTDYISHPHDVVRRLITRGEVNDEIIAAAWLHDVLENCSVTYHDLRMSGINQSVRDAVALLTIRGGDYFDYIFMIKENPIARKVKIADMLSNLADKPTERQIVKYAKALLILLDV